MEFENQSIYTPENLYGEYLDEMLLYLSINPSCLVGETALKFQNLINQHCERAWTSRESVLPSFGTDGHWLNTARPLEFEEDLKGKVYIMDFFTYCCINCIHILPLLKKVESEYCGNPSFAVIGVHSPKFSNEKHLERVKEAIIRNDIKHPVLNDAESKLWMMCGITCWPTVYIVGPMNTLLFVLVGEAQIDKLSFLCHHVLKYFESSSVELDLSPLPILLLEEPEAIETGLLFPGSVSTNGNKYLVISDTGHNRLLLMSKDLKIQETIGSGKRGCDDGPFNSASFNVPNGTAWLNSILYVADTGNHSIRKVDFGNKMVFTVFRSENYVHNPENECDIKTSFQSPWDLCVGPRLGTDLSELNTLYIAVAGSHQIWRLDLDSDQSKPGFCIPFAGSGKEENKKNVYRLKAGFAQPCGIAYSSSSPDYIYIADSESSTIKSIALKNNGAVEILIGGGRDPSDLFQFGDLDGRYLDVKLQHPMSVCVLGKNFLAITDTYNHKIKLVEAAKKKCITLNVNLKLCEPSGICFIDSDYSSGLSEKKIYVADTNNHQIVPIRLYESSLLEMISQPVDLVIESHALVIPQDNPQTEFPLAYDGKVFCHFKWNLKSRFKLNVGGCNNDLQHYGDGVFNFEFLSPEGAFGPYQPSLRMISNAESLEKKAVENPKSKIVITCQLACCDECHNVCSFTTATFKVSVHFSKSGPKCVNLFFIANL